MEVRLKEKERGKEILSDGRKWGRKKGKIEWLKEKVRNDEEIKGWKMEGKDEGQKGGRKENLKEKRNYERKKEATMTKITALNPT